MGITTSHNKDPLLGLFEDFFTLYHGIHHHHATIWDDILELFPSISCKCKPIGMSLVGFEDRLGDLRFALRLFWVPIPWSFGPQWRSRVVKGQECLISPEAGTPKKYIFQAQWIQVRTVSFRECNLGSLKIPTVSEACHTWCKSMVRLGDLCVCCLLFVLEKKIFVWEHVGKTAIVGAHSLENTAKKLENFCSGFKISVLFLANLRYIRAISPGSAPVRNALKWVDLRGLWEMFVLF